MHYKNGRLAQEGDPVITRSCTGKVLAGTLHSLNPGAQSCNGMLANIIPGGVAQNYVTVGELYHAEDAIGVLEAPTASPAIADSPAPMAEADEKRPTLVERPSVRNQPIAADDVAGAAPQEKTNPYS